MSEYTLPRLREWYQRAGQALFLLLCSAGAQANDLNSIYTLSRLREWYQRAGSGLFLLLCSAGAQANDLNSIAQRWTSNLKGLGPLLVIVFAIIGLICTGIGLYKFATAKRNNTRIAEGLAYIIVGSLLLSITAVSGLLSGTSFGSNEATASLNALGIN